MSTAQRHPLLLLVDDSPEICLIVERLARRAGQEVLSCGNVASAWEHLRQTAPDLLIVDLNLPGEDGLVLCHKVRQAPDLRALKVALFSNWDRSADIVAGLAEGVDYVLSKELLCRPEQWQARLRDLLQDTNSRAVGLLLSLQGAQMPDVTAARCAEIINQALRLPALRSLDHEIMQALFARAKCQSGWALREDWLLPDGRGLRPERIGARQTEDVLAFALALKEQIWCVVGPAGSAPYAAALAAGIPPLAEILARA
jgi:DNA-binding response OmpR family regulator